MLSDDPGTIHSLDPSLPTGLHRTVGIVGGRTSAGSRRVSCSFHWPPPPVHPPKRKLDLMDTLCRFIVEHANEYGYPVSRIEAGPDGDSSLAFGDGLFGTFVSTRETTNSALDAHHQELLHHASAAMNLVGLAPVIYWGYATFSDGYARNKVRWFLRGHGKTPPVNRHEVKQRITAARASIRQRRYGAALGHIGHLPQLGQTPFASKVVAFLAPGDAGVYDNQVMRGLARHPVLRGSDMFEECKQGVGATSSPTIQKRYNVWCNALQALAEKTNRAGRVRRLRPLDVERAIFAALREPVRITRDQRTSWL